ncbi:MAG: hypothetical protein C3F02_04320 [Parcubacteria group bacterium]|nr:MAG: hypothetical protein C3F02_04320 [Parcubacteria group bacterium]
MRDKKGFTLASLVVTIALVVILSALVFIWIDPIAKVRAAKDAVRQNDVLTINLAMVKYANDHNGSLPLSATLTTAKKVLCSTAANIDCDGETEACLIISDNDFFQGYLGTLPVDPDLTSTANTGYYMKKDSGGNLQIGSCISSSVYISGGGKGDSEHEVL